MNKLTIFVDEVGSNGMVCRKIITVIRHYASVEQTEAELRETGFTNIEVYGGFNLEPLYDPSLMGKGRQVFIARL